MKKRLALGRKVFLAVDCIFLIAAAFVCIFPIIHVFAVSFSGKSAATAGLVKLWPVDFTTMPYTFVLQKPDFLVSLFVSLKRVALGVPINMILTVIIAYPLSKSDAEFKWRKYYVWVFIITMLFGGGLIPWYMVINSLQLVDTVWALVLPGAVPVFNVILLINFFRELPKEIEESAFMDGASYFRSLCSIYLPLSKPALATLTLFCIVNHWNSWFDGLILMNKPRNYPLQSYLQTVIVAIDYKLISVKDAEMLSKVSDRTVKSAEIFLGALPVLVVYPFLQKYFTTGIVLGSVKG